MKLRTVKAMALASAALFGTSAQAVEIEYWQYFFDARVQAMEQLIESFEEANPDITVKMTHFPYADYRTKVAAAIPAGAQTPQLQEVKIPTPVPTPRGEIGGSERAIATAGLAPDDIDVIVVATLTPDYPMPSTAASTSSS